MTVLLDVNVLIALIDPTHLSHDIAHGWFETIGETSWATCPIVENGAVRIIGHPSYPNNPGSPGVAARILRRLRSRPGHVFWPDDVSLLDERLLDTDKLLSHSQVTDSYLLALAVAHGGRLATLDRRLLATAVRAGREALALIESTPTKP